ncbi:hypothetical protein ACOBQX_12950 [Actinokineospora sp. G85]|uniref:hypothetical protein n=1 Tax=Actinokineospora sp. G85 TaxID=3406626 RepID=UPI003C77C126
MPAQGPGFRAETDALAARAGQFDDIAARAAAIHRDLDDALAAAGPCWGADVIGETFARAYLGPAQDTLGSLGALPGLLGDVGGRFLSTARAYDGAEADNARPFGTTDV